MAWKYLLLCPGIALILTNAAYAAANTKAEEENVWVTAILSFLPILLFLGILYFFLKRFYPQGLFTKQMDQFERQKAHMERMEALLERIAVALEKRGPDQP